MKKAMRIKRWRLIYISVKKDPMKRLREEESVRSMIWWDEIRRATFIWAWDNLEAEDRIAILKKHGLSGNVSNFIKILGWPFITTDMGGGNEQLRKFIGPTLQFIITNMRGGDKIGRKE